jgi:uncharacterized membrane protein YgdD (TMEM256/DUF423 family)
MGRLTFLLGAVASALAVAIGAFGTHALGAVLTPRALQTFDTGVRYLGTQGIGLAVTGLVLALTPEIPPKAVQALRAAAWFLGVGIVVFCGSLFVLALGGPRWMGAVAPLGGTSLILGWIFLGIGGWRQSCGWVKRGYRHRYVFEFPAVCGMPFGGSSRVPIIGAVTGHIRCSSEVQSSCFISCRRC